MGDLVNWTQYFLAMGVLLGLLASVGVIAYAVQRGWILQNLTGLRHTLLPDKRLAVTETLVIDPRRRVVIIRHDDHEQIVLLGAERETVLASQPAQPTQAQVDPEKGAAA